ncbi:hypothetical protein P8452_70684 [Trifolium repens]|nr:hypothetical protein P8452_70684 [Trifolium repens]
MEYMFSQSLNTLSTHFKEQVNGRGMDTTRRIFEFMRRINAPRLTLFNHDEEQERLSARASMATASESARLMALQEADYYVSVENEQARIAAETEREYKRRADEEALKLLVSMGAHIAEVETNKILADQAVAEKLQVLEFTQGSPEDDTVKISSPVISESDRGKTPIIAATPPVSPKLEKGSPSSVIPPTVQEALNTIRIELADDMRDEIDELRVDLRTELRDNLRRDFQADIAASEVNTRQRMEDMMATLLKAIADIKKPEP